MPFKDLREFIARLEKEGQLKRIKEEVDWNLEAGAITRRALEENLPAPYFQKIKGYPAGYEMASGILGNIQRVAIAMDMAPDAPVKELIEEYLKRKDKPIKPVMVKDAPCKENILKGDRADLLKFPVPMIHEGDGGRYLGTWHITVSKEPGGDWVNWGMYRHMLHDSKSFAILAPPPKHFALMMEKAPAKPMEVALVIGTEPISSFCACTPMPYGVSEVDVAGGLRGEPVELVQCETIDLTVPATAEIVIEGEIRPGDMKDEGPFGEYTGYRSEQRRPRPVVRVKAITHRNNPIFTMSCMGVPVDESAAAFAVCKSASFLDELRSKGLPVTGAYLVPEGASHVLVVSTKVPYYNIAGEIAHVVWGARHGCLTPVVIVVEDDVDPCNLKQVFHAMMTKCHPWRGINKIEHALAWPLIPWLNNYEREFRIGARVYFDCTWPIDWKPADIPKRMSFAEAYPEDVKKKALAIWEKYGY
ncbi:MAG: UbiD family decarboxylase [Dehalococcoidia bacterium]|nr:UbiD family decarboxylase [Dehalococcoidia bacterium]